MTEATPPQSPTPDDSDEIGSLEAPIWVKAAAAFLALTGTFGAMIGFQIILSTDHMPRGVKALVAALLVLGIGAIATAAMVAKGRTWAAITGIVLCFFLAGLVWAPLTFGIFAFSTFAGAACSLPGLVLLAISIPACIKVTRNRDKFLGGL